VKIPSFNMTPLCCCVLSLLLHVMPALHVAILRLGKPKVDG